MFMSIITPLLVVLFVLSVLFVSSNLSHVKKCAKYRVKDFENKAKDVKSKLEKIKSDEKKCDKLEEMIEEDLRNHKA